MTYLKDRISSIEEFEKLTFEQRVEKFFEKYIHSKIINNELEIIKKSMLNYMKNMINDNGKEIIESNKRLLKYNKRIYKKLKVKEAKEFIIQHANIDEFMYEQEVEFVSISSKNEKVEEIDLEL